MNEKIFILVTEHLKKIIIENNENQFMNSRLK